MYWYQQITHGDQPIVLVLHNCTEHLAAGGRKDAEFIAIVFLPQMQKLCSNKDRIDVYIVNGATNVQVAGAVIAVYFPWVSTKH